MDLVATEDNPIPPGAVTGAMFAEDGTRLRYARWRGTGPRNLGTVCLFQGRAESIEKYFEVIADLRGRGFAVATLDWRGQGGSQRGLRDSRKGHVEDFRDYDLDLDALMQHVALPDCPPPHYTLAHSMGALVALRAARTGRTRFTRMVLSAPMIDLAGLGWRRGWVRAAAVAAGLAGFGETRLPRLEAYAIERLAFPGNALTSDPNRFARNVGVYRAAPQLAVGAATYGWLRSALKAMDEALDPEFGASIQVPVLCIAAGQDEVVSTHAVAMLARELRAGAHVVVPGARHEVMMERDSLREQFWAAFDAFVPGSAIGQAFERA